MHTDKISKKRRQREQLILALLQQPSLAKAAASIGMSTTTAWRICQTPEFQQEDREARRDDTLQLLGRLQRGSGAAVSTMLTGLVDKNASDAARVRSAHRILEQVGKGHGLGAPGSPRRSKRGAPDAPLPQHGKWEQFCRQYNARQATAAAAGPPSKTSKESRQREKFIWALLQQPVREKAAASIGISATTAWRISKTSEFEEEYRAACREDYSRTLARLAHAARVAVSVLERVMVDKNASWADRERAAQCFLDQTRKILEREDLALRAGPQRVDRRETQKSPSPDGQVTWEEFSEMYKRRIAGRNPAGPPKK